MNKRVEVSEAAWAEMGRCSLSAEDLTIVGLDNKRDSGFPPFSG